MADRCSVAVKVGERTVQCEKDMGHKPRKHAAEVNVLYIPDIDFNFGTDSTATVTWGRS